LASSRQYGNALLGVRHQEEEEGSLPNMCMCIYLLFGSPFV